MEKEEFGEKVKEIIERYGIDIEALKAEQIRLAKSLVLKDSIDFDRIGTIAGCDNAYFDNQIISAIVVVDMNMEVLEEKFFVEKAHFPYIPGFLAYREMSAMLKCYHKLENSPDVLLVEGNGLLHPRGLGIASHLGLAIEKPTLGIAKELLIGEIKDSKVYLNKKVVAEVVETKKGSNPVYVSIGNMISLESAVRIVKKCIHEPHKLPEPLMIAQKYAKKIREEFASKKQE